MTAFMTYKEECETLREQLSVAASEILALRKANKECVEYFNEAQKDLAEKDAEIERLQFAVQRSEMECVCAKREAVASQVREQQLVKHITRFILELDNHGSPGAWPVEALKHLRLAIKENQ